MGGGIDYVGTRLHAGIYAMRHQCRSIIVRVDSRMDAMSSAIPQNTISRKEINLLETKINSKIVTECKLDWKAIRMWKDQFQ